MSSHATGPRTEAGKARSAQNAVKHGIFAQCPVIPGEDPAAWDAFRTEIVRSFGPVGLLEHELAERVALQMWRQRRVARYEAELVAAAYGAEAVDPEATDTGPALAERTQLLKEALDRVVRYEGHVGRQLKEALKLLRECQAQRQMTPPGRTDAAVPPRSAAAPTTQPAAELSSFCQTDGMARSRRRLEAVLPRPGVSVADFDLVPKPLTAET